MQTLWKKKTPLHPTFAPINNSLAQDWFLLPHELQLQRAHAKTLHAAGILTDDEWAALNRGLDTIEQRYADQPCPESDAEDLHTWIEMELATLVGEVASKIHTARSRNDQVATLLKLYVIAAGRQLTEKLAQLTRVCCLRAKDWSDLVFPLQTHCQFAAPGSVGFWALRYAAAFDRVRNHLNLCAEQWKRYCPLGAGAVGGSSIPIDRAIQAAELHFGEPARNALDATTTRDECLDLLALAAQAALHLQSLATDVIAFSQTPFGWTIYPAAFGTGSSMMPNKTNPDAMELLRGEANTVLSAHSQSLLLL
ncbi:MAG: argininosuccinate lyase, partial [Planctomycetes bacterium]|nr:argininosuccinate lyase [Planctomycetota bacterium]